MFQVEFKLDDNMKSRSIGFFVCTLIVSLAASAFGQQCRCQTCESPTRQRGAEWNEYWNDVRSNLTPADAQHSLGPTSNFGTSQVVFLDFDSGEDKTIEYTQQRRDAIQAEMESIYQRFSVSFVQSNPGGQFSAIVFNEGNPGGVAEDIDFRNLNPSDNAVLNVNGIGLTEKQIVPASALIASHELGHLLGLRHADMFGPIGQGVLPGFGPFYIPEYTGPDNAIESEDHVMVTGAFGIPITAIVGPSWFSERSSVKLAFAESGTTTLDIEGNDSLETAQPIDLQILKTPNTIVSGANEQGSDFSVNAAVVEGSLNNTIDGLDVFQIEGRAGDIINMALLSTVPDRLAPNSFDANLSVFDSNGQFVDYYGSTAFNESELKTSDCIIFDLELPSDGSYFIQVDSVDSFAEGVYELFVYRFNGMLGDVNCDADVNLLDVMPMVDAITGNEFMPKADVNCDGKVDLLDVKPFVDLLNGS